MCAARNTATSPPSVCVSLLLRHVNRKHNTLRMSYRAPGEPRPHLQAEGGISLQGRPSSDVTKGFERLHERSYY